MENMDKRLTAPKWVLIVQPKIPQMSQNLSTLLFVCLSPKVLDFNEKRLHWASVVRALVYAHKIVRLTDPEKSSMHFTFDLPLYTIFNMTKKPF